MRRMLVLLGLVLVAGCGAIGVDPPHGRITVAEAEAICAPFVERSGIDGGFGILLASFIGARNNGDSRDESLASIVAGCTADLCVFSSPEVCNEIRGECLVCGTAVLDAVYP